MSAQVEFRSPPTRCPYCHESSGPDSERAVCSACLAPHHSECWDELGRCSACGVSDALRATAPAAQAPPTELPPLSRQLGARFFQPSARSIREGRAEAAALSPGARRWRAASSLTLASLTLGLGVAGIVAVARDADSWRSVVFVLAVLSPLVLAWVVTTLGFLQQTLCLLTPAAPAALADLQPALPSSDEVASQEPSPKAKVRA